MELIEDQIFENYAKQCKHCTRNFLSPYEYDYSCVARGFNVVKTKNEFKKIS